VERYNRFFSQVTTTAGPADAPRIMRSALTGEKLAVSPKPSLQEAIGLSDKEAASVHEIATSARAEYADAYAEVSGVTLEGRLRALETGDFSWVHAQEERIRQARRRAFDTAVGRLRGALGEARFQVVDAYVKSGALERYVAKVQGQQDELLRQNGLTLFAR